MKFFYQLFLIVVLLIQGNNLFAQTITGEPYVDEQLNNFQFGAIATVSNPADFDHVWTVTKNTDPYPFLDLDDPEMVGTLQWAIRKVNTTLEGETNLIQFDLPESQLEIILTNNLPDIERQFKMDGFTQFKGENFVNKMPKVIINTVAITWSNFRVHSDSTFFQGLEFRCGDQITVQLRGSGGYVINCIFNNYRNVMSATKITVSSNGVVQGNIIGTDTSFTNSFGEIRSGISSKDNGLIGGHSLNEANIIANIEYLYPASTNSIYISGENNEIIGNIIFDGTKGIAIYDGSKRNLISKNTLLTSLNVTGNNLRHAGTVDSAVVIGKGITFYGKATAPYDYVELFLTNNVPGGGGTNYIKLVKYLAKVQADVNGIWIANSLDIPKDYNLAFLSTDLLGNTSGVNVYYITEYPPTIPLCQISLSTSSTGNFKIGNQTGKIIYDRADDCPVEMVFGCLSGSANPANLDKVIASSATAFADNWSFDDNTYAVVNANTYEKGIKGRWRPASTYAFNTPIRQEGINYQDGTFTLEYFNWQQPSANNRQKWLLQNKVTQYSPHGDPIEELNVLEIPSAAKFGYHDALPFLTVQNASYGAVMFESFESNYPTSADILLEDGFTVGGTKGMLDNTTAHAGKVSLKLLGTSKELPLKSFNAEDFTEGMLVRFWVKVQPEYLNTLKNDLTVVGQTAHAINVVAHTGEWTLCEAYLTSLNSTFTPVIAYSGVGDIWLDDIRLQPADAQMTAYVYDPATLRLLTIFDDQHFGLYYQYNAEGKLVRKKVETERGIRTIQETQYHISKSE